MKFCFIFFLCATAVLISCGSPANSTDNSGLFPVKQNGKCGYIDKLGKLIVTPQFQFCDNFSEGFARIVIGGKSGFIDTTGKIAITPQFGSGCDRCGFSEGLAVTYFGSKYGYIDKSGQIVINPENNNAKPFSEGLALTDSGFVSILGKVVIPRSKFRLDESFKEGLARVVLSGDGQAANYGFIDKSGSLAFQKESYHIENFSEGLAAFISGDNSRGCGYVNKKGDEVIRAQFENCNDFLEGLAAVKMNGKYGFIETSGKFAISPQFTLMGGGIGSDSGFHEGLAAVSVGGKYGYIDKTGKFAINPQFDEAYNFTGGLAKIWAMDVRAIKPDDRIKVGYIDKSGKVIWNPSS